MDLDVTDEKLNEVMDTVFKYFSNKQPIPLQVPFIFQNFQLIYYLLYFFQLAAVEFFKILLLYDQKPIKSKLELWQNENNQLEYENNLCAILKEIKDAH